MSLAEAIKNVNDSYEKCIKRQSEVYKLLNTARSKRIQERNNVTANIVNLVEFWREEEVRAKFMKQAELLKSARREEVKRVESLDETIMLALGMSMQEAVN